MHPKRLPAPSRPLRSRDRRGRRSPRWGAALGLATALLVGSCGDPAEDVRSERLADLVATTEQHAALGKEFGRTQDVLRFLRPRLQNVGERTWIPSPDGALHVLTLRAFHQWNSTAEGREVPRAVDFEDPLHPIHAVVARAEALRAEGVDYLHVIVPTRLELYPELLMPDFAGVADFPGLNEGTLAFQAELARRGVESVPLLTPFAARRYGPEGSRWLTLRAQPTWSPAGIGLAAQQIAEAVRRFAWFEPGPATEGVDFVLDVGTLNATQPPPAELQGAPGFDAPEMLPIEAVKSRDGLTAHVPDRESPIVLLGEASAISMFEALGGDLAGQLYRQLGHRLDVVSSTSGAHWTTFEKRPDALAGKRLVIEVQSSGFRLPPTAHAPLPEQ